MKNDPIAALSSQAHCSFAIQFSAENSRQGEMVLK
jgi:hypothetical protein